MTDKLIGNVEDRRRSWIGSWEGEPLDYANLRVGQTVIYRDQGRARPRAQAGTVTSWHNGIVFARYTQGDTAAGAKCTELVLGVRPLDGPAL